MSIAASTVRQQLPETASRRRAPAEPHAAAAEGAIGFGPFRLLPTRRLLLAGDQPVPVGSRAMDLLIALVERPGELIGKDELLARAWPGLFVEEGNLKVQIAGLRRALGDRRGSHRYLVTIPGRGYRFVAPVTRSQARSPRATALRVHNLPARVTRLVDRTDSVRTLAAQLPRRRFITIVGPGGIGKTTLALAVAETLIDACEHGARFVDLAQVDDPLALPGTLAAALGLEPGGQAPLARLIAALADQRLLLVLDNCEHVIEAAAALAARVLRGAPGVRILATSREPLRAEGERVHRLAPLAGPPAAAGLTAAAALGFPAVQLFVERAAANLGQFELADQDAPFVAEICRRLDGIPLAIELAAARVDAFGIRGLAAQLDDMLRLLTGGRRPAPARQQSLRAALDWGHELLPERERAVLRRLALFGGGFTLEAATAVAASAGVSAAQVVEGIANLVAKSLLTADHGGAAPCYRLLATTRAFALEKLAAAGEREQVEHRLARRSRVGGPTGVTPDPIHPTPTWFPLVFPIDGEAGAVPLAR